MSNTQQGKIGFDCSAISNANRMLLSFFLSFSTISFLSLLKGINCTDMDFEHTDVHKNKFHMQFVVHKIRAH